MTLNLQFGTKQLVFVTEVTGDGKFFVQLDTEEAHGLSDLSNTIGQDANILPPLSAPSVGMRCCAHSITHGQWFRGLIIEAGTSSCAVFYTDYGNVETLPLANLRAGSDTIFTTPFQAVCCILSDFIPTDGNWNPVHVKLRRLILDKECAAVFCVQDCSVTHLIPGIPCYRVTLSDLSCGHSVAKILIDQELGQYCFSKQFVELRTRVPAVASYIESPGNFWLQLLKHTNSLDSVMNTLNSKDWLAKLIPLSFSALFPGVACCVAYSEDGRYYRAEVIRATASEVKVLYVDFGNSTTVPPSSVFQISHDLVQLPAQALQCQLSGVEPVKQGRGVVWSKGVIELFEENCSERELDAVFESQLASGIYKVSLSVADSIGDLAAFLVGNMDSVASQPQMTASLTSSGGTVGYQSSSNAELQPHQPLLQVPTGSRSGSRSSLEQPATQPLSKSTSQSTSSQQQPSQPSSRPPSQSSQPSSRPPSQPSQPSSKPPSQPSQPSSRPPSQPSQPSSRPPSQPSQPSSRPPSQSSQPSSRPPSQPSQPSSRPPSQSSQLSLASSRSSCTPSLTPLQTPLQQTPSKPAVQASSPALLPAPASSSTSVLLVQTPSQTPSQTTTPSRPPPTQTPSQTPSQTTTPSRPPPTQTPSQTPPQTTTASWPPPTHTLPTATAVGLHKAPLQTSKPSSILGSPLHVVSPPSNPCAPSATSWHQVAPGTVPLSQVPVMASRSTCLSSAAKEPDLAPFVALLKSSYPRLPFEPQNDVVYIFHAESPCAVWCQLVSQSNDFINLMNLIAHYYSSSDRRQHLQQLQPGEPCCLQYSEDNSWCRGLVLAVHKPASGMNLVEADVLFVDYGCVERVSASRLMVLFQEFLTLPAQAVCVTLCGVGPKGGTSQWSSGARSRVKELCVKNDRLTCTLVELHPDSQPSVRVHLVNVGGPPIDIGEILVREGFADLLSKAAPAPHSGNASSGADFGEGSVGSIGRHEAAHSSVLKQNVAMYPQHQMKPQQQGEVVVSHMNSLGDFYCQWVDDASNLDTLSTELQEYAASCSMGNVILPLLNMPVLSKFSEDGLWYRALITAKHDADHFTVLFVDFGNTENVTVDSLLTIPQSLLAVPSYAFHCSLSGNFTNGTDVEDSLLQRLAAATYDCTVVEHGDCFGVKLFTEGQDLASALEASAQSKISTAKPLGKVTNSCEVITAAQTTSPMTTSSSPVLSYPVQQFNMLHPMEVVVSHVSSLSDFYCQLTSNLDSIGYLNETLQGISHLQHVTSPQCNMPVLAKFSEDGSWYRALTLSQQDGCYLVVFVDFGNTDTIPETDLMFLPPAFLSIPPYAFRCTLDDCQGLTSAAQARFSELVQTASFECIIKGRVPTGCCIVELKTTGGKQLVHQLKEEGYNKAVDVKRQVMNREEIDCKIASSGKGSTKGSPQKHQEPQTKQTDCTSGKTNIKASSPPFKGKDAKMKHLGHSGKGSPNKSKEAQRKSTSPARSTAVRDLSSELSHIQSFPRHLPSFPINEWCKVAVSYNKSPSCFYVQLFANFQLLHDLVGTLNKVITPDPKVKMEPEVKGLYAAKFSEDGLWYRAQVLSVSGTSATVHYIDYGNSEVVAISSLRALTEDALTNPPPLAVACKLSLPHVSEGCMKEVASDFAKLVEDRLLYAKFQETSSSFGDPIFAELRDEAGVNIAEHLCSKYSARVQRALAVAAPQVEPPLDTPIACHVSFIEDMNSFYCQLLSSIEVLDLLGNQLQEMYSSEELTTKQTVPCLAVNDVCAARYSEDQLWYRARVTGMTSMDVTPRTVSIFFIDYGNSVTAVPLSELRTLDLQRASVPSQAIWCSLRGADIGWSQEKMTEFESVAMNEFIIGTFSKHPLLPGKYEVHFREFSLGAIAPSTLGQSSATSTICAVPTQATSTSSLCNTDDPFKRSPASLLSTQTKITQAPLPSSSPPSGGPTYQCSFYNDGITSGSKFNVMVVTFHSPEDFYCTITSSTAELGELMDEINEVYAPTQPLLSSLEALKPGMMVLAQFTDDNVWYRARIMQIDMVKNCAEVGYIDYGNKEMLTHTRLMQMDPKFMGLKPQCIKCQLDNPHGYKWSSNASSDLFQLVAEKEVLKAEFVRKNGDVWVVNLFDECANIIESVLCAKKDMTKSEQTTSLDHSISVTAMSADHPIIVTATSTAISNHLTSTVETSGIATEPPSSTVSAVGLDSNESKTASSSVSQAAEESSSLTIPPAVKHQVPSLTFAPGSVLSVYLVVVVTPIEFWCQVTELDKFDALMDDMYNHYSCQQQTQERKGGLDYVIGDCCVVLDTINQEWCRVKVLAIDLIGGAATVVFLDYGGTRDVRLHDLVPLMPEFAILPAQAIGCSLTPDLGKVFSSEQMDYFNSLDLEQEYKITIVCCCDDKYIVDLLDLNGSSITKRIMDFNHLFIPVSEKCGYASLCYDIGTTLEVYVSHVDSPSSFYCQPLELAEDLDSLIADLREFMSSRPTTRALEKDRLQNGQACAALYSEDNEWYRAEVDEVMDDGHVAVTFVDYGNSEITMVTNLTELPAQFMSPPVQALRCSISGTQDDWTEYQIAKFTSIIDQCSQVTVKLVDTLKHESMNIVKVLDDETEVDFSCLTQLEKPGELIADINGLGLPTEGLSVDSSRVGPHSHLAQQSAENCASTSLPTRGTMSPSTEVETESEGGAEGEPLIKAPFQLNFVVKETIEAKVVFVHNPNFLYVQRLDCQEELAALSAEVEEYCANFAKVQYQKNFTPGDFVLACYSVDSVWYRAKVIQVHSDDCVEVQFFDYGNVEKISPSDMVMCPENFLELPVQAIPCSLAHVPSRDVWPPDYTDLLNRSVEGKTLKLTVEVPSSQGMMPSVLLEDSETGMDVSDAVLQQLQVECDLNSGDTAAALVKDDHPPASENSTWYKSTTLGNPHTLTIGGQYMVNISEMTSPKHFSCTLVEDDVLAELQELLCQLYEDGGDGAYIPMDPPKKGDYAATVFSGDGKWYRTQVEEDEDGNAGECAIHFFDFGNGERVSTSALRLLDQKLCSFPCRRIDCFLSGVDDTCMELVDANNVLTMVGDEPAMIVVDTIKDGSIHGVTMTSLSGDLVNVAVMKQSPNPLALGREVNTHDSEPEGGIHQERPIEEVPERQLDEHEGSIKQEPLVREHEASSVNQRIMEDQLVTKPTCCTPFVAHSQEITAEITAEKLEMDEVQVPLAQENGIQATWSGNEATPLAAVAVVGGSGPNLLSGYERVPSNQSTVDSHDTSSFADLTLSTRSDDSHDTSFGDLTLSTRSDSVVELQSSRPIHFSVRLGTINSLDDFVCIPVEDTGHLSAVPCEEIRCMFPLLTESDINPELSASEEPWELFWPSTALGYFADITKEKEVFELEKLGVSEETGHTKVKLTWNLALDVRSAIVAMIREQRVPTSCVFDNDDDDDDNQASLDEEKDATLGENPDDLTCENASEHEDDVTYSAGEKPDEGMEKDFAGIDRLEEGSVTSGVVGGPCNNGDDNHKPASPLVGLENTVSGEGTSCSGSPTGEHCT